MLTLPPTFLLRITIDSCQTLRILILFLAEFVAHWRNSVRQVAPDKPFLACLYHFGNTYGIIWYTMKRYRFL